MKRSKKFDRPMEVIKAASTEIVAAESIRVKGRVYEEGAAIPEALWNPGSLVAALKVGTVYRRATKEDTGPG